jgi:hypothetical protein
VAQATHTPTPQPRARARRLMVVTHVLRGRARRGSSSLASLVTSPFLW